MQRGLAERQSRSGGWAPLTAALARDPPGLGPAAQDLDKRCASSSLADESILGEGDTAKLEMKASAHRSARTASQRLPAGSLRSACVQPAQHALQHRRLSANGRARFAAQHRQGGEDADAHRSQLRHE